MGECCNDNTDCKSGFCGQEKDLPTSYVCDTKPPEKEGEEKGNTALIIAISCVVAVIIAILLLICCCKLYKKAKILTTKQDAP